MCNSDTYDSNPSASHPGRAPGGAAPAASGGGPALDSAAPAAAPRGAGRIAPEAAAPARHALVPPSRAAPAPPAAPVRPVRLEKHGHGRTDAWFWLSDRGDPAVLAHLEAENAYAEATLAHTRTLQRKLFEEIRGRVPETDESVPWKSGDWWYLRRWEKGREYPILTRRRGAPDGPEQVMLDVNELAAGHAFCAVRAWRVSPDGNRLAFAVDTTGRGLCVLRVKDLRTGELLPDVLEPVGESLEWAGDSRTLFYAVPEPLTLRPYRICRHVVGTDSARDTVAYEEADDRFACWVDITKSRKYLLITSQQSVTAEVRFLAADRPEAEFAVFEPRRHGHEYHVDHLGDLFWIRTDDGAPNFRLMSAPESDTRREAWREVVPGRKRELIEEFELFPDHVVLEERADALVRLRVRRLSDGAEHAIEFGEPAYAAWLAENEDPASRVLRFVYSSLTTPDTVYDYDLDARLPARIKRAEVVGGHDPADYACKRLHAVGEDGTRVPISLVYRRDLLREGGNPLLLYGYGAYGISTDATFSSARLSLLDRGFVFAIAHVRGGLELGRRWYEEGRLDRKRNTFTDFIACARHLVREGWTAPDRLFAQGRSAGGLLVGAVVNLAPELFRGIVAEVPFVDTLTTMLDASIPLTTGEYEEWGDPNEAALYGYILSYSPYDNVAAREYPALLVTAGLHDPAVQYWEPAKWVAKLRAYQTGGNPVLLRTDMGAGHSGPSARSRRWRELAVRYAFLLDLAGFGD